MDFFAHQEAAQRQTKRLLILFLIAVTVIVTTVYLAVLILFFDPLAGADQEGNRSFWHPGLLAAVAAGVLSVIGAGSLYKLLMLRDGGRAVATLLGGRLVEAATTDRDERRLLNVVEEMALASGMAVPPVYVLEREEGINAFAAGLSHSDAVVAVSQGALQLLSRAELQGVIGHEFSHILRGDMRLNLRLIGLLHGILLISLVGYGIVRSLRFASAGGGRRSGGVAIAVVGIFGLALMAIGSIGVFFGRWIKSAVSRQREFLADAAAVQFTRDPSGIAGALKKIGGLKAGSRIRNPRAEEASHLFFGDYRVRGWAGMLSTHPPLDIRIRRLDPGFDGTFPTVSGISLASHPQTSSVIEATTRPAAAEDPTPDPPASPAPTPILDQIGNIDQQHLDYAAALIAGLPDDLRRATRLPGEAIAVTYALLLDRDPSERARQLALLAESESETVLADARRLYPATAEITHPGRLALLDLLMPSLARIGLGRFHRMRKSLALLAESDRRISLFEYTLLRHVLRQLGPVFGESRPPTVQYYALDRLEAECSVLLSALAHTGSQTPESVSSAFDWGVGLLGASSIRPRLLPRDECTLSAVDGALDRLALVSPRLKRDLLRSAAETIAHDRKVTVAEAELVRAVAHSLDCPVPPLLPGQGLD